MKQPPNILLVMTDQQRADTIAAAGNGLIRTPTLDRLTREGTRFDRCYTPSPVCVSARCALMTGLPPHASGCVDNLPMPREVPTLPARLSGLGYRTHGIGKMHFNPDLYGKWGFHSRDTSEEMPGPEDDYIAFLDANGFGHVTEPHGLRSEYYYLPQPSQLPARLHHTTWVADRAIEFLDRHQRQADAEPFFLMASFIKPHPPFESPVPFDKLYRGPDMPGPARRSDERELWTYWNHVQNRYKYADAGFDFRLAQTRQAAYYGAISYIDQQLGRILDRLGPDLDNTLVLFTSDHGESLGDYGCVGKRSMLDASARVPMLARLPARFGAGRVSGVAVGLCDVLPTCLAAAGADRPVVHAEGQDLARLADDDDPERMAFSQFQRGRYALHMAADARSKFVYSAADEKAWQFDAGPGDEADRRVATYGPTRSPGCDLEISLQSRFIRDGDASVADFNGWIRYEKPTIPDDPDEGLLYQDADQLPDQLAGLGEYHRPDEHAHERSQAGLLQAPDPYRPKPRKDSCVFREVGVAHAPTSTERVTPAATNA